MWLCLVIFWGYNNESMGLNQLENSPRRQAWQKACAKVGQEELIDLVGSGRPSCCFLVKHWIFMCFFDEMAQIHTVSVFQIFNCSPPAR
jgi:hypothetical protein